MPDENEVIEETPPAAQPVKEADAAPAPEVKTEPEPTEEVSAA